MAVKEQTWQQWVRAVERESATNPKHPSRLYKGCLAALTGTDVRALNAFVACLKLYSYTAERRVLTAASIVLVETQEKTRWIAKELIAFVMEWDDRERLWPLVAPPDPLRCRAS
jgi:hypothetical protein